MKYERQILRLSRMIWRNGRAAMYINEKGPVARLSETDGDGTLVGVYTCVDMARVLEDIEEAKAELVTPLRRYVRGKP